MTPARAPATSYVVVGIGDIAVSADPAAVLITYALGSCVAVAVHDPVLRVAGLVHFMLPQSNVMPDRAKEKPGMFADTGVPLLFHRLYAQGCKKGDLVVKIAGGGHLLAATPELDIGRRNVEILDRVFARSAVTVAARDVGGMLSRTVEVHVATGRVTVRSHRKEYPL